MGTYRSRQDSRREYMDSSNYEPKIWPEEERAIELLDEITEGGGDESRDAIVKMIGDLRSKVVELHEEMEHIAYWASLAQVENDGVGGWRASLWCNQIGDKVHATGPTCVQAVQNVLKVRDSHSPVD